jgi:hypothetical protein
MKKTLSVITMLGLLALLAPQVRADNAESTASVNNIVPVSSAVAINGTDSSVTLTENDTTNVTVTATVTDNNGCGDIASVSVKLFRTDLTSTGSDDANYRYTQAATLDTDTCEGGSDLSSTWTAVVPVEYYADPTDAGSANASTTWSAEVTPIDSVEAGTAGTDDTIEMATLKALNVSSPIAFGVMPLGSNTGTDDQSATVTNTGNAAIGTQVDGYGSENGDGYAMTCTTGNISVENEKYSKTAETAYASKTALSDTAATITDFSVAQRTGTSTTGSVYWGLAMPSSGITGDCSGTVVFTAL